MHIFHSCLCGPAAAVVQEATDIYKQLLLEHRDYHALNVYVALCYSKLDYFDVSSEIVQTYLQQHPSSAAAVNLKACNLFRLYNGPAAEAEVKVRCAMHCGNCLLLRRQWKEAPSLYTGKTADPAHQNMTCLALWNASNASESVWKFGCYIGGDCCWCYMLRVVATLQLLDVGTVMHECRLWSSKQSVQTAAIC